LLSLAIPTAHSATINLRLGHILPQDSPDHRAFVFMAERIKALTNGEVNLQIFPASQLGAVNVMMEGLQAGSLDMMVELLEFWGNSDKRFGIFGIPYLFRDRAHFVNFLKSPTFKKMTDELGASRNVVFFGNAVEWQFRSDRTLLSTKPIFAPSDLKGVKLRMFQARVPVLTWQTLGANTVIIPWGETYTALATGTIEAVTARVEAHYGMKQTEVAKFMTFTEEYYQTYLPVMSKKTYDKLKPEHIAAIKQAASEAGAEFMRLSAEATETYKAKVRDEHGVSLIYPPLNPWREAVRPIHVKLEEEGIIPKGLLTEIQAIK
jgi:tripartite ATP-independent transporter DctP family solute receptor